MAKIKTDKTTIITLNDLSADWLKETRKLKQKVLADRIRETVRAKRDHHG